MSEGRWVLVIASGVEGKDSVSDRPWSGVAFLKHPVGMAFHQCFGESLLRFDRCEGAVKWSPPNRERRRPRQLEYENLCTARAFSRLLWYQQNCRRPANVEICFR
jgi:hypothetical protein